MIDSSFTHAWKAQILSARPRMLSAQQRQFVYPARVEEVERGALEVLVKPAAVDETPLPPDAAGEFLATCALGFAGSEALKGVWACPNPAWMCAVAGGYAYLIDTLDPKRWEQVEYRPVTEIRALPEQGLLIFAGFHALIAWGRAGKAWQTRRLSWEGVRITSVDGDTLTGLGWDMYTDRELEFEIDLKTGDHQGGGYLL